MSQLITLGGKLVGVGGQAVNLPHLADQADFDNVWDMRDAVVEGGRAIYVEDPVGHRPMRTMPGTFSLLGATPLEPLPGPLYIPSSAMFNGHPAVFCDHQPQYTGSFFGDLFSALSPNTSADGTQGIDDPPGDSAVYFNAPHGYPPPYWVAVLGRLGLADDPLTDPNTGSSGVWDATHGGGGTGPTVGRLIVGLGGNNWQFSNFGPGLVLITTSHVATVDETVLLIICVNGASSFMEVNWRSSAGVLMTTRATGFMNNWNFLECFIGWVHGPRLAGAAIRRGFPDEDEIDQVRHWGSYFIPPAGALPDEP